MQTTVHLHTIHFTHHTLHKAKQMVAVQTQLFPPSEPVWGLLCINKVPESNPGLVIHRRYHRSWNPTTSILLSKTRIFGYLLSLNVSYPTITHNTLHTHYIISNTKIVVYNKEQVWPTKLLHLKITSPQNDPKFSQTTMGQCLSGKT